jgi:uncharacterized protein YecE (DUF72 family)
MPLPVPNLSAQFRIGTIGFSYADWRPAFYPADTRQADILAAYASAFDTLELDTTFYGIPPPERIAKWTNGVPSGFLFCPKTPRLITHDILLSDALPTMHAFLASLTPMRDANRLGPILIQFPPTVMQNKFDDLAAFLRGLPSTYRYAVEFRHRSWLHPSTEGLLTECRCAWVGADYSTDPWPLHATTDFFYLRFVGQFHSYPKYDIERVDKTPRLEQWLGNVCAVLAAASPMKTPVFAFFADDFAGHAPATANRLRRLLNLPTPQPTNGRPLPAQQSLF